jgi:hypothetical protein
VLKRTVHGVARQGVRMWLSSTALTRAIIPQPPGLAAVHTGGASPVKILLAGSGASIGFGVLSHDLALAGHLARQVTAITGRAVDMDIVVDREMTAEVLLDVLTRQPLERFDAVVLSLGLIETLMFHPVESWRSDLNAVFDLIGARGGDAQEVFLIGVPPLPALQKYPMAINILGVRHAASLNDASSQVAESRERTTFLPFEATSSGETDRFRSSTTYSRWAELLSQTVASRLSPSADTDINTVESGEPVNESARQATLDSLHILDTAPEERFDRITATARDLLGTASAAITFVDHDRHWFKSRVGLDLAQVPRLSSFCEVTLQRRELFTVEDASKDSRFAHNAMVLGPPFLRFYAGYPIEAPNGVRVGTVCVFDPEPREFTEADSALLRGLALMVQNELRKAD